MKRILAFIVALLLAPLVALHAADLGVGNVSCYGADNYKTPNINKFVAATTDTAVLARVDPDGGILD